MQHSTGGIAHTPANVTPVVEQRLEREIDPRLFMMPLLVYLCTLETIIG